MAVGECQTRNVNDYDDEEVSKAEKESEKE
jgi:hypothetical protein